MRHPLSIDRGERIPHTAIRQALYIALPHTPACKTHPIYTNWICQGNASTVPLPVSYAAYNLQLVSHMVLLARFHREGSPGKVRSPAYRSCKSAPQAQGMWVSVSCYTRLCLRATQCACSTYLTQRLYVRHGQANGSSQRQTQPGSGWSATSAGEEGRKGSLRKTRTSNGWLR
jgi:hypothetical protein